MPSVWSKITDVSCHQAAHTWDESCSGSTVDVFVKCFKYALTIYTPLYTATALLNRKGKQYFLKKLLKEILQSSLFLSSNGVFAISFFCLVRMLFGGYYMWSAGFVPGVLASFCSILIERKSRRGALATYMLNQAFDTVFNMMKRAGMARNIEFGEVIIFSASVSALMLLYRTENMQDGFIKSIINSTFNSSIFISFFVLYTGFIAGLTRKMDVMELKKKAMISKSTPDIVLHAELSLKLAGKAFMGGYGIQMALSFLKNATKILKSPGVVSRILFSRDHVNLGAFFGSLVLLYNMTEKLLQKYNKNGNGVNAAIAGGVAGCAMFFQRSSNISLYILSKTLELCYMNGIKKGFFPYVKHFDTILYSLCTGLMLHAAILQPTYLKPTYWNFLVKLTGNRFNDMDRTRWDPFGYDSSWKPLEKTKQM